MPVFDYVCEECGARTEILVRGEHAPECPQCGSQRLVKQASAFAPVNGSALSGEAPPACSGSSCCQLRNGTCPYS